MENWPGNQVSVWFFKCTLSARNESTCDVVKLKIHRLFFTGVRRIVATNKCTRLEEEKKENHIFGTNGRIILLDLDFIACCRI